MAPWQPGTGALASRLRRCFEFAARTRALLVNFFGVLVMMLLVFPALPIHGEMIDLKLHYDLGQIQTLMVQYGADGRTVYALASPTLDTLFPLLYVTFFSGLLYRFRPTEALWVAAFIPVFAGAWDLCENLQITVMLLQFPDLGAWQVRVASFFTSVKHLLSAVCALTALVFVAIFVARRLRHVPRIDIY